MVSVFLTIPNLHWIHKKVAVRVIQIMSDGRCSVRCHFPTYRPYENNLHHCVKDFLESGRDFWLSIDADNPPRNNPLELVELDKDIIGLPTPVWHFIGDKVGERPIYYNAYDYDEDADAYREHRPFEGLQRVDAIGTGCFLIARRVFEDHPELQKGAFFRKHHADGTVHKGNDMSFCERAKSCGCVIWCHYDYPCDHFCELNLNDVSQAFTSWRGGV